EAGMGLVIAVATIASYGAVWWIVGLRAAGHGSLLTDGAALLVLWLLLATAWWRRPEDTPERRRERARRGYIIGIVTAIQAVLILLALHVLRLTHRVDLLAPVVALVIGLHFLAFARLFPAWMYYLTSALLLGLGVTGFFLGDAGVRLLTVSLGCAAILWATCVAVLIWPETRRRGP
ncbi:MAG TPA: hypothetical protein VF832_09115, partial [Longimicrobiales bacterium]